jgi:diaminopimelate epimerase
MDCTHSMLKDPSAAAIALSDRHFGVGGDGLILICPSQVADFRMAMYNADGSEGAMCGNGIRCVAKFVYDKGLTDKTTLTVETRSGIKTLELTVEGGKVSLVKVDMGMPNCAADAIPVLGLGEYVVGKSIRVADRDWKMTCVSMGNPHAVVWTDDMNLPLE